MKTLLFIVFSTVLAAQSNDPPIVTRVRFYPAPGAASAMIGGQFQGSNVSETEGFEPLATIASLPAEQQWTELSVANYKIYRWLRYMGPPGSYGKIADMEFYAGQRKVGKADNAFGSVAKLASHGRQWALDGKTTTWYESHIADGQYVGVDLKDSATARTPVLDPPPGDYADTQRVALKCETPGAVVRYTLDGSTPTATHGSVYNGPIEVKATETIAAAAFLKDRAPSPMVFGSYLLQASSKPGLSTLHVGNSLTKTTVQFSQYTRTAGFRHEYDSFTMSGAPTIKLWNAIQPDAKGVDKDKWAKVWNSVKRVDEFTVQPRDFNVPEEADYCIRFFDLVRAKAPEMQPWLYTEWVEMVRERPTDKGEVPSFEMQKVYPALTWQESMSAMVLYMEELQHKIAETYHAGKRPRVLPSALAMGWMWDMIENGRFPGLAPGSYYSMLHQDHVHPNDNGKYLVDLTWFSAFYRQSPERQILPVGTVWNPEQNAVLQHLAWDVIKNYPDCGLYEEGTTPVSKARFSPEPGAISDVTRVTLSSATPGAWFRYTLDGTTPTRTRGYIYCGVISVRPGMTVKAVAYKSGMADSEVSKTVYAAMK